MIKKTLGGERLGAGQKMEVDIEGYGRSTHNLDKTIRTTMSAGTLIPAYQLVCTPGDTIDMNIRAAIQTNPTLGALYGSYIFGVDVFQIPFRIYIGGLQYNAMNLAVNMQNMKIPQINIRVKTSVEATDNSQVGTSCVLRYLGIKGIGSIGAGWGAYATRGFNALPAISYYDIFKNYYANKQEPNCYMIHSPVVQNNPSGLVVKINNITIGNTDDGAPVQIPQTSNGELIFTGNLNINTIWIYYATPENPSEILEIPMRYLFQSVASGTASPIITTYLLQTIIVHKYQYRPTETNTQPQLQAFPLQELDNIRPILNSIPVGSVYTLWEGIDYAPWKYLLASNATGDTALLNSQEGLMVKTYQSDLYQNFIKTATVTELNNQTAINTAGANFTIDTLNFAMKLNNLLQREAASGHTLQDYIEVAYGVKMYTMTQIPMFMGGMRDEIVFDEVVSSAETTNQPLGQIAGRGRFLGRKKGGRISIKIDEWSYIMAIAHITPRIDYSQGNRWDTNLKTVNDIHKPSLDQIGYQDLITEQMAYWDTIVTSTTVSQRSWGKQPAWINYTTDVNETFGLFAEEDNMMFMTLNRRYEKDTVADTIKDLTTYIDPVKYNYIFAQTELSAQNFRVQIAFDVNARRKMSAKLIPNL